MPKYIELRRLLVQTRTQVGLSQMALAKRLGRPQSYVSKFERGERRLEVDGFKLLRTLLSR